MEEYKFKTPNKTNINCENVHLWCGQDLCYGLLSNGPPWTRLQKQKKQVNEKQAHLFLLSIHHQVFMWCKLKTEDEIHMEESLVPPIILPFHLFILPPLTERETKSRRWISFLFSVLIILFLFQSKCALYFLFSFFFLKKQTKNKAKTET